MTGKLLLIDSFSLLFRAYYAMAPLTSPEGIPTSAVYGFLNMFFKLVNDEKPTHIAAAFDSGESFRKNDYSEYKAGRQKTPEDILIQVPILKEILNSLGVIIAEADGFEGDDIIGTLSRQGEKDGYKVHIVTGDKDMLQLIDDSTQVILTKKGLSETAVFDRQRLLEDMQLEPWQVVELKGLMGDSSDNIPGIPKVGEKTAMKLLAEYRSVEGVLAEADYIKGKLGESIRENKDLAILSKKLATICTEVPINMDIERMRLGQGDKEHSGQLFDKYGFRTLKTRLHGSVLFSATGQLSIQPIAAETQEKDINIKIIQDESGRLGFLSVLEKCDRISLILYSHGRKDSSVTGYAVSCKGNAYYFPLRDNAGNKLLLKDICENKDLGKICHGAKTVMHVLGELAVSIKNMLFDTEVAAYLLNPSENGYFFAGLAADFSLTFQVGPPEEKRIGVEDDNASLMAESDYAGRTAILVEELYEPMLKRMREYELDDLYEMIEMPLVVILFDMERTGIRVDASILTEMGIDISKRIESLQAEIIEMAGEDFNINSTQQLGRILFEKLELPAMKKTKGKTAFSTDVTVLESLRPFHPIIEKILENRQLVKLYSTYIDGLKKLSESGGGYVHTTFNQTVTATGRLSSTEPNLQNIPIRLPEGRKIRRAFTVSNSANVLIAADYSQIELRVLAHLSDDPQMKEAFMQDVDIHAHTAAQLFHVPLENVGVEMRSRAKTINFGVLYGMSEFRLSNEMGIPRAEAKEFIENYFSTFANIKEFKDITMDFARKNGYVTTLLNRRRYLPDINSRNFNIRSNAERIAVNTPIQGTAADIIKLAMVNLKNRINREKIPAELLLQVHDELIFEAPESRCAEVSNIIREEMENACQLSVPIKVDIKIGENWYEMQKKSF